MMGFTRAGLSPAKPITTGGTANPIDTRLPRCCVLAVSHRCARSMKIPAASSPVQGSPERPRQFTSSTMPVRVERGADTIGHLGDVRRRQEVQHLGEHDQIERLVRPFVRHLLLLEANPRLIRTRLACVRQRCLDDIHRQQSVTAICQQPGQHTDRAAGLKAGAKAAVAQACDRSSGISPAHTRSCGTATGPDLHHRGAGNARRRVTHDRRSWQQERLPRCVECPQQLVGQLKSTRIVSDEAAILRGVRGDGAPLGRQVRGHVQPPTVHRRFPRSARPRRASIPRSGYATCLIPVMRLPRAAIRAAAS